MQMHDNKVVIIMKSHPLNEAFARVAVSGFLLPLDPTVDEITDIKTAVSEAVTNAIIHGYGQNSGDVTMTLTSQDRKIIIEISDEGYGIENIQAAREPLYTTKPELERSGLGFTVMENYMDEVTIESTLGSGTTIIMEKTLAQKAAPQA